MAEFPALPLWTDAYLADTSHLTTIEHGAYLLLLMAAWRSKDCRLPNDDKRLARYCRMTGPQWKRIKSTILEFFYVDGEWLYQGRLTDEREYVRKNSAKQSANAKARWGGNDDGEGNSSSSDEQSSPHMSNQNEITTPGPVGQPPSDVSDESVTNPLENRVSGDAMAMPDACHSDAPTPTPTPIEKKEPKGSSKKGTRLPDDWALPDDWWQFAMTEGMDDQSIRREADKFRDYWLAQPGQKGIKLDWQATWRNWIRRRVDDRPRNTTTKPQQPSIIERSARNRMARRQAEQ